jgi:DHA2 family lincomycin resistance protein-like MFS transporter
MIAFPRSMMVFAGMAVLGVILASLMFRFSTRRPPEMREVK